MGHQLAPDIVASCIRDENNPSATRGDLADVIQSAAVANAGSLPLLSFVLDELYKSCQRTRARLCRL